MINKKTYEELMETYLGSFPSDLDLREGTLAHTVMSVTAMSVAQMYEELGMVEENAYASTATGEMLDKSVEIIGMERLGKINAVVKIEGGDNLIAGDVLSGGELTYKVTEVKEGYCLARCETAGEIGNSYKGEVVPQRSGVEGEIKITAIVLPGCEEEDDESLRQRYMERILCPVCTGNVSYYKDAVHSLMGVGGIKVESAYEGAGTVKVIITDSNYAVADEALVKYVKEYLDPEEYTGLGYGVVPIGHKVAVESVEAVDVEINLLINGGNPPAGYVKLAREAIQNEVKKLNKKWDTCDSIVIWNRLIEDAAFSAVEGIRDVQVTSINGEVSRFILGENQIIGEVTVHEG